MDAIIGLGSNLGSREAFLRVALRLVAAHARVELVAVSSLYATPPLGPPQPDYLNAAARVRTDLAPRELLAHLQRVETELGRVREVRWGPRTIDLDFLHGGEVREPDLEVPHPGLRERAFALAPLLDVAPELSDELGPALAALGRPASRAWSEVRTGSDRIEVEAIDAADALALALGATLEDGPGPMRGQGCAVRVASVDELVARLRDEGGAPGWLVVEALSGSIRARFTCDPGHPGANRAIRRVDLDGSRCTLVLDLL